jgi:hypothetical protein
MKARFAGTLRLVEVDTIGVPVFSELRGNRLFVPETDGDLRIARFVEFFNEDGFRIDYDGLPELSNASFKEGDPVPIAFWIGNKQFVIAGDADKDEPAKMFGKVARTHPVLRDIARVLDDARSGRIQDKFDEWASETMAVAFSDVFYETPVASRYWVSRYRTAIAEARKLADPPHPIDNKLRSVANAWLKLFASKTDIRRLVGLLGNARNQVLSQRQIDDAMFAFLLNKYAAGETIDIDIYCAERTLHVTFPDGLYGYYIEHGWPRVPFKYRKVDDFAAQAMQALADAFENDAYAKAAKLVFLLFGRADLPSQIEHLARQYLVRVGEEFTKARKLWRNSNKGATYEWRVEQAKELLAMYDEMLELDSIIIGSERLRRKPKDGRFGVPTTLVAEWQKFAKSARR